MSTRWKEYFESHGAFTSNWLASAVSHWGFHEVLYGKIAQYCQKNARIMDIGSGPGWSVLYLASLGYDVTGIDNEPKLVDLASQQAHRLGVPAKFEFGDAFDLSSHRDKFDLVYSCGVLEHFDRDITVKLLQEQAKCAEIVIIEIPTKYTMYAGSITDERIYSINQLAKIMEDAGLQVIDKFGYGDICATSKHIYLRRVLPRALWRIIQNFGYAYAIAIVGKRK